METQSNVKKRKEKMKEITVMINIEKLIYDLRNRGYEGEDLIEQLLLEIK